MPFDSLVFAVDFDNTCVKNAYPAVGKTIPFCVDVLKEISALGHKIILNTMRNGEELRLAEKWFERNGIELFGVNVNPTQVGQNLSTKVLADYYIDDRSIGIPLDDNLCVNWHQVYEILMERQIL